MKLSVQFCADRSRHLGNGSHCGTQMHHIYLDTLRADHMPVSCQCMKISRKSIPKTRKL